MAAGEEELVAEYMVRMNAQGEHDFTKPDGSAWGEDDYVTYGYGHYDALRENPRYIAKKNADEVSYAWDQLITLFTDHLLAGTSVVPDGQTAELRSLEAGLRQMALLSRFMRRSYGAGVLDALEQGQKADKFTRTFIANPDQPRADTGFFFLTLKPPSFTLKGGYEQYRAVRRRYLEAYALTLLRKHPQLKRIVGIATEARLSDGQDRGSSEDLIYAEPPRWTNQLLENLVECKKLYNIDQPGNSRVMAIDDQEFPAVER
jgi:hypothetical protein